MAMWASVLLDVVLVGLGRVAARALTPRRAALVIMLGTMLAMYP